MNDNKWIKLHLKLLDWEWYKDTNTTRVFIHLLLKANWKDGKFEGQIIPRGSFVTSLRSLSKELGMSVQSIRTVLNHLKSTNEITIKTTNKYRVITVINYELYQQTNKQTNNQLTNNQQATNNQLTTIEEYKTIDTLVVFINNKYGREIFPNEYEKLQMWVNEFGVEIVEYAFQISIENGRKRFDYVQGILRNWKSAGYKTKQEILENEKQISEKHGEPVELFDYNWLEEEGE